jgi:hypothetical protein
MLWQTSLQTVSRTTEAPGEYPEEGPAPKHLQTMVGQNRAWGFQTLVILVILGT